MTASTLDTLADIGTPLVTDYVPIQRGTGSLQRTTAAKLGGAGTTTISPSGDITGITDATAIQAAITSGLNVLLAPGIFYTNATLNVITYASCGQTIRGCGSYYGSASAGFSTTPPPNTTVIRPTSAVSKVFLIDGTPIGGVGTTFIQGFGIENLAIDMTSMTDAATSMAVQQVQAFDIHYTNVRVMNFGSLKESWNFQAGAYVSTLLNCQGGILYFDGVTTTNATTTISIVNGDFQSIYHDHFQNITLSGGAIQRPYSAGMVPVYIQPGKTPYAYTTNTTGLFAWVLSEINTSQQFTSIGTDYEQAGGFPVTYTDASSYTATFATNVMTVTGAVTGDIITVGQTVTATGVAGATTITALGSGTGGAGTYTLSSTPGTLSSRAVTSTHGSKTAINVLMVDNNAYNTTFINPTFAGMYLLDYGINTRLIGQGQSGVTAFDISTGVNYILNDFRVSGTLSGPVGFAGALGSETSSSYNIAGSTGIATFKGAVLRPTADGSVLTFQNAAGTVLGTVGTTATPTILWAGNVQGYQLNAKPNSDGTALTLQNALGTALMFASTNATPSNSQWNFANGIQTNWYSDNFGTQTVTINASTGVITSTGQISTTGSNFNTVTGAYFTAGTQVVGARQTGWGAASSTLSRTAYASYAGQTYTGSYVQATVQATDDALKLLSQKVAALITDLTTHGLIGA